MPTAIVHTSAPRDLFSPDFLGDTTKLISDILNKPFKGVAVILCSDVAMRFADAVNHVIWVDVIGVEDDFADDEKSNQFISAIVEHLSADTGIPTELISVSLQALSAMQVGFAGGEMAHDRIMRKRRAAQNKPT